MLLVLGRKPLVFEFRSGRHALRRSFGADMLARRLISKKRDLLLIH